MADAGLETERADDDLNFSTDSIDPDEVSSQQNTQEDSVTGSHPKGRRHRRTALEVARATAEELTAKTAAIRSQIACIDNAPARTKKDDEKRAKLQASLAEKASQLESAQKKIRVEEEKQCMAAERAKQKQLEQGVMTEEGVMKVVVARLNLNFRFSDSTNTSAALWDLITEEVHRAVDAGELPGRDKRTSAHYQAKWASVVGQYKLHWAQCHRARVSGVSVDELEIKVTQFRSPYTAVLDQHRWNHRPQSGGGHRISSLARERRSTNRCEPRTRPSAHALS